MNAAQIKDRLKDLQIRYDRSGVLDKCSDGERQRYNMRLEHLLSQAHQTFEHALSLIPPRQPASYSMIRDRVVAWCRHTHHVIVNKLTENRIGRFMGKHIPFLAPVEPPAADDLPSANQEDRTSLCVDAALLLFNLRLLQIRVTETAMDAKEVMNYPSQKESVQSAIKRLKACFAQSGARAFPRHAATIATGLKEWADKLSPEANEFPNWVAIAPAVVRELRYHYHRYRTLELWARLLQRSTPDLNQQMRPSGWERISTFLHATIRSIYGLAFGYGFRYYNFLLSAVSILVFFGGWYWMIDTQAGCALDKSGSGMNIIDHLLLSLSMFTTVGNAGIMFCSNQVVAAIQRVASLESLAGYVMLGVLVTVFWNTLHEFDTRVSGMRLGRHSSRLRNTRVSRHSN